MLTRFIVLLFFSLSILHGADDAARLESASKAIESSDEIEQYRGYNECKTIYLRANLDKNEGLAKDALECIISGGKKLGVDISRYENDLQKRNSTVKAAPQQPKLTMDTEKNPESKIPTVVYDKTQKTSSVLGKFTTPAPEKMINTETAKKTDDISMTLRHRLIDARWKDAGLELIFDTPVEAGEIRTSKIIEADKQRFRYIVDIDSGTLSKSQTLEHKNINRIQISQYNSKTARLVFEHNHAISVKPAVDGKSVYIDLNLEAPSSTLPLATPAAIEEQPPLKEAPPPLVSVAAPDRNKIILTGPIVTDTKSDRSETVIVIDPGHGGKDSGAVGNGYMEKDIVLQISQKLAERLRSMGYTVNMTRNNDTFIELKDRTKFANDKMAKLFVSVHANSIPKTSDPNAAQGIETYFLSPARSERAKRIAAIENEVHQEVEAGDRGQGEFLNLLDVKKRMASNIFGTYLQKGMHNSLRKQFPNVKDNGVREAPFWVLVGAQMPAVLLEVGYISHPEESARIADDRYQKWMVEGLSEGIVSYLKNPPI